VVVTAVLASGCSGKGKGETKGQSESAHRLTIFFTGELKGTIEPCGCTTNPLGDLARTAKLLDSARTGGATLYVDGGSMLYTHNPIPPDLGAQEDLKAKLLLDVFGKELAPAAIGLGPFDLSRGPSAVAPARMAANVPATAGIALEPAKVVEVGGVKVGLYGVVSPAALEPFSIEASDPVAAARTAIAELRGKGAQLVVGIAHMTKGEAKSLAREAPGTDILVVGQNLPEPKMISRGPDRVGDTWLVAPANRGQVVTRLDVTMRENGALIDAIGEARAKAEIASLDARVAEIEGKLGQWKADPNADPSFVEQKEKERTSLIAEREALAKSPLRVPAAGPYFAMEQVEIAKRLPCAPDVVAAKVAFDKAAGEANLEAAKNDKPRAPDAGQAGYVGSEECSYCHAEALSFWNDTRHAHAWKSLTDAGKEFNRDCIYCHVTGFGKPGGSTLGFNEILRNVQCETCHGPGSIHVEKDGHDQPRTIVRAPEKTLCIGCHSEEHSDTFEFEAYLRDVTGTGHGAEFRAKLGDGPTGRELRSAGLERTGKAIGAGCPK